eukprot:TRINITY_DN28252_c0_g1_i1.p1 TRINITY_DN28252_c0_g1~~TRINITY_DN28252_c0_g1_i1.p1  ORF type:complete len:122 (+),score=9.22 TRINITY_DN28252_c0_g1_i1:39-404(+)
MIRRPPRSTLSSSSAASDVYKRQTPPQCERGRCAVMQASSALVRVRRSFLRVLRWPTLTNLSTPLVTTIHYWTMNRTDTHIHLSLIHISEPTRLLSISYAVFCLKKKTYTPPIPRYDCDIH